LRILGWAAGTLLLLVLVSYFVVTSSGFFKGVILPKVSQAMNADVTVTDASLSPFSSVTLRGLSVRPAQSEPVLTASEVRLRYSLFSIIGGNIKVDEVALVSPKIYVEQRADGTSNLDPLLKNSKSSTETTSKPPTPDKDSKPPQIDIKKITMTDGSVRVVQRDATGGEAVSELGNLNLSLTELKNGQVAKLTGSGTARHSTRTVTGSNATVQVALNAALTLGLTPSLEPSAVGGNINVAVNHATGEMAQWEGFGTVADIDLTPTEVKRLAVRATKGAETLAELRISGPLDLAKKEGVLKVELGPIDRRLLNLAGGNAMDFGPTTIASSHTITISRAGQGIVAQGDLKVASLSLVRNGATLPSTDLETRYDVTADLDKKSGTLRVFELRGRQSGQQLLEGGLTQPMPLAWGGKGEAVGDAALTIAITNLNLADWKAFAADLNPSGRMAIELRILSQQGGQRLGFELAALGDNLGATVGTNRFSGIGLDARTAGQVTNFNHVRLASSRIAITKNGQPAAAVTASGLVSVSPQAAALEVGGDADLPRLLQILPQPDVQLSAGTARWKTLVRQEGTNQSVAGEFKLAEVTGRLSGQEVKQFGIGTSYDVAVADGRIVDIRRLLVTLVETSRAKSNQVELTGRLDLSQSNALEGALKLTADTLDVTPYYDLVANKPAPAQTPSTTPTPPTTPEPPTAGTNAPAEPDAIKLPVRDLVLDARIRQLYLREVEGSNVQATVKIQQSHVLIQPMSLLVNGAPLAGDVDLDLSVPGWRYKLGLNAAGLPLEPLANSFSPDYRGRAKGEVFADVKIDGAGVTGANLRKSLGGHLGLSFTNADIQIIGPRLRGFLVPIAAALNAPGLLNSPLRWVGCDAQMGTGKINLTQLALVSPAFTAATKGDLTIADNLGASRLGKWPMTFQLERALAEKIQLAPKDTPTNVSFVALPEFIKVAGTLNAPKPDLDLKSLAGAAMVKYVDKLPGVDEKTGNLIKGLGNMLSGSKGGATNAAGTNAPAATNKPTGNLLDLLKRPK
jgi:uncharacterized protein involved in outer membrane biogenesis